MRTFLAIITMLCLSHAVQAQKLVRDEVDEFTGAQVRETSWEWLVNGMASKGIYRFKLRKVDSRFLIDFKIMSGGVFAVSETTPMMIKLTNAEVLKIYPTEYSVTCLGCATYAGGFAGSREMGLSATYSISPKQLQSLYDHGAEKLRLYTTDDYREAPINEKRSLTIRKTIAALFYDK